MTIVQESPAKALVNQGGLRVAQGDFQAAEQLYREAIDVDPANATAHSNLGYLLALSERHEEAIAAAEDAIALDPTRSAPWAHVGMSYIALGRVKAGLTSLEQAVRLDPSNYFAWDAMGRTWLALDRAEEAERCWSSALAHRPDDADLLISLATALAAQQKTGDALRMLHRATTCAPEPIRAWVQLGVVALLHSDYGTSGDALLHALERDPTNSEARFHLALLHVLVGAHDESRQALDQLIAEGGGWSAEAQKLLRSIRRKDG